MRRMIFILVVLLLTPDVQGFGKNITTCVEGQYFSTITLNCAQCGNNQKSFLDIGCQCADGYQSSPYQIGFVRGKNNEAVCKLCANQADCTCLADQSVIKHNLDGSAKTTQVCVTCTSNAYLDATKKCVPCPHPSMTVQDGKCVCGSGFQATYNTCVSDAEVSELGAYGAEESNYDIVNFVDQVSTGNTQIRSSTIQFYYLHAAVGCSKYGDMKSCQQLANLCLMTLEMASSSCAFYRSIVQARKVKIPQLFYEQSGRVVIEETPIKMSVSFQGGKPEPYVHQLQYYIIEYSLDGEMVGQMRPLQGEMILCGTSRDDIRQATMFGINYSNSCVINFSNFMYDIKTRFFQLFLQDYDGTYIPIPILIENLKNEKSEQVNTGTDSSLWQFVYRFFLTDAAAGLTTNFEITQAIRFAETVRFNLYIDNSRDDKMFLPYVSISYMEVPLLNGIIQNPNQEVYFQVDHTYDPENFWNVVEILFILLHILIGVVWILRIWIWIKHNPPYIAEQTWGIILFIRALFLLLDTWSTLIFYFLLMVTGYWYCFFKLQESIYVLMPLGYKNYRPYEGCFYTMFACRMISVLNMIYNQGELEIFFVDWEKTEINRPKQLVDELQPRLKDIVGKYQNKQSVWRTLLIANEFNELQTFRIVSLEWTLMFVGFFLVGLKWENTAASQPNLNLDYEQKNYVLRYFIASFVYLCVGLVQIIVRKLFDIWFPIAIEDFVDLCSIANISILIVDDVLHGYYIHGENPIGYSEGSAEHLQYVLHNESMGKGKKRGFIQAKSNLNPGDEELQTFEIFLSQRFRECYDKVFMIPLKTATNDANNTRYQQVSLLADPTPENLDMQKVEMQRQKMQFYLKDVLTQIRGNHAQYVRNKLALQRFFNYPPNELDMPNFKEQSLPVFYRDPDFSFKNIFFCGQEFYLLITDICIFNFWLMITHNVFATVLLSYMIISGLFSYRQWLGERNLADKSKIDQRFLI